MFLRLSSVPLKTVFFRGIQPATLKGLAKNTLERLGFIRKNCPGKGVGPGQSNSKLTVSSVTIAEFTHSQIKVLVGLWLFILNCNTKIIKIFQDQGNSHLLNNNKTSRRGRCGLRKHRPFTIIYSAIKFLRPTPCYLFLSTRSPVRGHLLGVRYIPPTFDLTVP
jgi:hypothetical protein